MAHKICALGLTLLILVQRAAGGTLYDDDNVDRLPTWLKTEAINNQMRYFDGTAKQLKPNLWKKSTAYRLSDAQHADMVKVLRAATGDKDGKQTTPGKTKKVWDYAQYSWYRDGDVFVVPESDIINELMRAPEEANWETVYKWHVNDLASKDQSEKSSEKWHIQYSKDWCGALGGTMFVPRSEAEFIELFEQDQICAVQKGDAEGTQRSKFQLNLIRDKFKKTGRCTNFANGKCQDKFNVWHTDDRWFDDNRYTDEFTTCKSKADPETVYATFEPALDKCADNVNVTSENGNLDRNQKFSTQNVDCWQGNDMPKRYQNVKNKAISELNIFKMGNDVYQKDCMVAQCDQTGKLAIWTPVPCNERYHVPVCRVPLVKCDSQKQCETKRFCGKVSEQINHKDLIDGNLSEMIRQWTRAASGAIIETSLQGRITQLIHHATVNVSNVSPKFENVELYNSTKHLECNCAPCGCIESNGADSAWRAGVTPYDSNIFRRYDSGTNTVSPKGDEYAANRAIESTMQFKCETSAAAPVKPRANFNTLKNAAGYLEVKCIEDFDKEGNKDIGRSTKHVYTKNKQIVAKVSDTLKYAYDGTGRIQCPQRFDDFCETVMCPVDNTNFAAVRTEVETALAAITGQNFEPNLLPSAASPIGTKKKVHTCSSCYSGKYEMECKLDPTDSQKAVWSQTGSCEKGKCTGKPTLPDNAEYVVAVADASDCNAIIQMQCKAGFLRYNKAADGKLTRVVGNFRATCSPTPNAGVATFAYQPAISTVVCKKPCTPPTGTNTKPVGSIDDQFPTDTVQINCLDNYHIGNATSIIQTCGADFKFPHTTCIKEACTSLPTLVDGYCYDPTGKTRWEGGVDGVICRCNKCKRMWKADALRTTEAHDGHHDSKAHFQYVRRACAGKVWNPAAVECLEFACGNPPHVDHADLIFDADGKANAACEKTVAYKCQKGYTGSPTAVCNAHGYFTVTGVCKPNTCKTSDLANPEYTINAVYVPSTTIDYHALLDTNGQHPNEIKPTSGVVPVGTQVLFECFQDFSAIRKSNILDISCDLDRDAKAARGTPGEYCADGKSTKNDKVRQECMPNGEWSARTYSCMCDDKLAMKRMAMYKIFKTDLCTSMDCAMARVCPVPKQVQISAPKAPSASTSVSWTTSALLASLMCLFLRV